MEPVSLIGFALAAVILMFPAILAYLAWSHHRETKAKLNVDAMAHSDRVQDIEDRLKVLERIVTDKGYEVASQIDALRDRRRMPEVIEAPAETERLS